MNLSEKGKRVEVLNGALEDVVTGSGEFFRGAGRPSAERWLKCLEEWNNVCESVLSSVGKKLGVGESMTDRKSSGVSGTFRLRVRVIPNRIRRGHVMEWQVFADI